MTAPLTVALVAAAFAEPAGDAVNGELLAALGACPACHTAEHGDGAGAPASMAGGYAIDTKFGTFYGPNLTPDPMHGIGAWSFQDFVVAMRDGRAPGGHRYYPAFPYPSFAAISDSDLADLWAWLRALPASPTPNRPHEPKPGVRGQGTLALWQSLTRWDRAFEPTGDPVLDRGAYLGRHVAHCGECHTPRDSLGRLRSRREHWGYDAPPAPAPDITTTGLAGWTLADVASFLADGMPPDGDATGGEMRRVVRDGTSRLNDADRRAIATWVLSLDGPKRARRPEPSDDEDASDEW
jgi:mono/diheme cytochrome c family protein